MRPNWFVALRCQVGDWYDEMLTASPPPQCVRVFAPEDLHLTVAFLGAVKAPAAERAFALASLWPTAPTLARLGSIRAFGPKHRFSALSVVLTEGRVEIEAGMAACTNAMRAAAGLAAQTRPPVAHMTIARPQRRASDDERARALSWARALPTAGWTLRIDELALYTWAEDRSARLFQVKRVRRLD